MDTDFIAFLQHTFAFDDRHPLLFTQLYFWVFFAVVILFLSIIGRSRIAIRNAFLCAVSFFFYYKTSGIFILILCFTTLASFFIGRRIHNAHEKFRTPWLAIGIITNLLVLAYFKYSYFLADMIFELTGWQMEVVNHFSILGNIIAGEERFNIDAIVLPVGISFYTFQCISYLMDIYRKRITPVDSLLDYGFYVSFFPQLVAGPIVRANEFIGQLYRPFFLSRRWMGIAVFWILNGLAKKIILSDYLAVNFIDRIFANPSMYSGFENLSALFLYSLQVYADFSGYTDIAIGIALMMGFHLPRNFNSPYKATNAGGFWKRWHMSLSRWLQDYLYIPMGGNRNASAGTYIVILSIALIASILSGSVWVAIIILALVAICTIWALVRPDKRKLITTNVNAMNTMLLGGLWHGASWNFMIWGGLNGIGMIIYKIWKALGHVGRVIISLAAATGAYLWADATNLPIANIAMVWLAATAIGATVPAIVAIFYRGTNAFTNQMARAWAIVQTFVFITFTRLFFRAGSNLDPAEANRTAWETAQAMVQRIGSKWATAQIPEMIDTYRIPFALFVIGMVIHWLPEHFKRRYRICFASMPLYAMTLVSALVIFIVYQFVTADLQKFIYFQF